MRKVIHVDEKAGLVAGAESSGSGQETMHGRKIIRIQSVSADAIWAGQYGARDEGV